MEQTDPPPFLELVGLDKSFGEAPVLEDVSLAVGEGEIVALLGPSGSGKTTVLRLLAGFETPDRGEIRVAGESIVGLPPGRRGVGMVFQHYALFPHMTVFENVAFGLEARRRSRDETRAAVAAMLELVDLAGFGERRVGEISGGQQQRVALARALAPRPRLLLLDEPLSNLDPSLRERTRRLLRQAVRQVGITTLLVTHEQEEAFHLGDRVALLHRGHLEQVGRPEELYAAPRSLFVATFIGRASRLTGVVESAADGELSVRLTGGGEEESVRWAAAATLPVGAGTPVELVVRPEALRLAGRAVPGALGGRVRERRFTGVLTYATVGLDGGAEVEVLVEPGTGEVGDRVWVERRPGGPVPRAFVAEAGS